MLRLNFQLACCAVLSAAIALGQGAPVERSSAPLTMQAAVDLAGRNYPTIRASLAEVAAAQSGVDLAKTAYLPRTDLRLGVNRATRNNVFGLILPNAVIPAISGPVQDDSTITSTFGSSAGVLFSYEPFDFGLRRSNVQVAEALQVRAEAGRAVTEYEISLAAADAYLQAAATQRAVAAAEATVERMQVFNDTVDVLVKNELRPGADSSRARAELARARSELIRAEEEAAKSLATLAQWLGVAGETVAIEVAGLVDDPPLAVGEVDSVDAHPLMAAQDAEISVADARRGALEKEWRPTFQLQSALYGRGTGARIDGMFQGGAHGLAPSEGNWAVGFNMNFDLMDQRIASCMEKYGVRILRIALAAIFIWFGMLKPLGLSPAADLVKNTVYWLPPEIFLPILGWWEVLIGVFLLYRPTIRASLFLLFLQMPGTMLPLVLLPDVCFTKIPFGLTLEGQYIVKNLVMIGSAIVVGGTVRRKSSSTKRL